MSRNRQPNSGNSCIHKISWEHPTQFETAEHRQSESLEGYGIPSDSLLPICFTVDEAGLVLAVNPAGAASWGYRVEELDGQPIFNFFHPKDRATLQVEFATFVQHPEQEVRGKFCLLSKEGSKLAVKVTVQPLQYIDAKVVFLLTCEVCNNVTKRKRKQGELRLRKPIEETLRQNFDLRNRELLTLQRISEIHLPEALKQRLLELLEFAIEAGELETYEHELAQPDGVHTYEVRIVKSSVDEAVCIVRNITESKQAEEALQQQCIRERLVGAIAQRIHQSLDLEEILNTTVAEVRQFLHTDRVLIYRVWSDGTGSAVTEAVVPGLPTVMGRTFPEEVFPQESQHLYCQGRILAIEDIEQADVPPCLAEFVQQFGVKAKLVVPILQDEALWGLLIAHHCSSPRQWQPFEIDLLKSLATQVAIAIQQSELYKQTQHQAQKEQALNRVIQAIRKSLDLTTIFSTAASEIAKLLNADRAEIFHYLPELKLWLNVADYHQNPDLPSALGLEIPDQGNLLTARLKRLEVIRLDDARTCQDKINRDLAQLFPGAWLVVPLRVGSSVWGSLGLVREQPSASWLDLEVELTCAIADQLAIAIQQSELFRQVQRLNASLERQVRSRTAQLELAFEFEATLKRITDRVRDSLDEGQIWQTAVQELGTAIGVKCCNAALYNFHNGTSTIYYEYSTSVPPSKGSVTKMVDLPEIYAQLLQGECFQFCARFANLDRDCVSILVCPIFDNQGIIGDLWLVNHKYYAFSEQDIRLVQQVANQCAIAIRQARLYQTAQTQVEELEKLNRLKDDFLSTVSHELRTPVCNIKMATQMLEIVLNKAGILDAQPLTAARYFQILQDECQREISLINNLLDLSRLDAGTEPLILTTIESKIWIQSIAEPFAERAENQQQHLTVDLPSDLPALTTDLSHLERILTELLNNACKYTPSGGMIRVSAYSMGKTLQMRVSNSGIEIPESELSRIFDKFYRIPSHDPWKHGGTGLGLALVKKLVEHLGATIQVESSKGQTTFTLLFPLI